MMSSLAFATVLLVLAGPLAATRSNVIEREDLQASDVSSLVGPTEEGPTEEQVNAIQHQADFVARIKSRFRRRYMAVFEQYDKENEESAKSASEVLKVNEAFTPIMKVQDCVEYATLRAGECPSGDNKRTKCRSTGKPMVKASFDLLLDSMLSVYKKKDYDLDDATFKQKDGNMLWAKMAGGGTIPYEKIEALLVPEELLELTPRRADLVTKQFNNLVGDDETLQDKHLTMTHKAEEFVQEILAVGGGEKSTGVTLDVFKKYYKSISDLIVSDDYFELMFRNAWHLLGGKGWAANTVNLRVCVFWTPDNGRGDIVQQIVALENDKIPHTHQAIMEEVNKEYTKPGYTVLEVNW